MKKVFSNRKGQAALEYLITYGWAFLVIIAAVSALSYFGLLSPEKYMPDNCDFGQQMRCVDQYIDSDQQIIIRIKNDFGANITVFNAVGEDILFYGVPDATGGPVIIPRGEIKQVKFTTPRLMGEGTKERFRFIIQFQRQGGTNNHNVSGTVFTEVSEPLE